ncbi:MAG: hypothetical protein ACFFD4_04355 [Candidatus Odinarchaeota archaeon]
MSFSGCADKKGNSLYLYRCTGTDGRLPVLSWDYALPVTSWFFPQ